MSNQDYWTDTEKEFLAAVEQILQTPPEELSLKTADELDKLLRHASKDVEEFCRALPIEEQAFLCCLPVLLGWLSRAIAQMTFAGLPERVYTLSRRHAESPETPTRRGM